LNDCCCGNKTIAELEGCGCGNKTIAEMEGCGCGNKTTGVITNRGDDVSIDWWGNEDRGCVRM